MKLCENYRGAEQRVRGEVAGIYAKQGDEAARAKKQAEDDALIQSLVSTLSEAETSLYKQCMEPFVRESKADHASLCADRAKTTIKRREAAEAADKDRLTRIAEVRAGLATDSELKLFDTCIDGRGETVMPSACDDSARSQYAAQVKDDAMRSCGNSTTHRLWEIASAIATMNMQIEAA